MSVEKVTSDLAQIPWYVWVIAAPLSVMALWPYLKVVWDLVKGLFVGWKVAIQEKADPAVLKNQEDIKKLLQLVVDKLPVPAPKP